MEQLEGIRQRVRASIESIERGEYLEYEGRDGLKKLADGIKARGRKLLAQEASGPQCAIVSQRTPGETSMRSFSTGQSGQARGSRTG